MAAMRRSSIASSISVRAASLPSVLQALTALVTWDKKGVGGPPLCSSGRSLVRQWVWVKALSKGRKERERERERDGEVRAEVVLIAEVQPSRSTEGPHELDVLCIHEICS